MNKILLVLVLLLAVGSSMAVSCSEFKLGNVYGSYVSDGVVYHNVHGSIYGYSTMLGQNYYTGYNYYVQGHKGFN